MNFQDYFHDICQRAQAQGRARLPPEERHVLSLGEFLVELNNGGLHQYFANSAGDNLADLLGALEALGCTREKELVTASLSIFGAAGYSRDRDSRAMMLFPTDEDGELNEELMDEQASHIIPLNRQLQDRVGEIGQRNEEYALAYASNRNA